MIQSSFSTRPSQFATQTVRRSLALARAGFLSLARLLRPFGYPRRACAPLRVLSALSQRERPQMKAAQVGKPIPELTSIPCHLLLGGRGCSGFPGRSRLEAEGLRRTKGAPARENRSIQGETSESHKGSCPNTSSRPKIALLQAVRTQVLLDIFGVWASKTMGPRASFGLNPARDL